MKKHVVHCPTCNRAVVWSAEAPFRPFCSERCRLIDLGAWVAEQHSIAGTDSIADDAGIAPAADTPPDAADDGESWSRH